MKRTLAFALGFFGSVAVTLAEEVGRDILRYPPGATTAAATSPKTFGTSQDSLQRLGAQDFAPATSTQGYDFTDGSTSFRRYSTSGTGAFIAHPKLPSGALILGVEFDVCDIDPGTDLYVIVLTTNDEGGDLQVIGNPVITDGTPGCDPLFVDTSAANLVVDNSANQILLDIVLQSGTSSHSFAGATVFYRLQVSPAPAVASFNDVPVSHPFFQYIEALKNSGITGGCQTVPPLYCPDAFVTRGQMAVFLAKALGLQFP